MKCPHCSVEFHDTPTFVDLSRTGKGTWHLTRRTCPACLGIILDLGLVKRDANGAVRTVTKTFRAWPAGSNRSPCPPEVPKVLAEDYNEACLVLSYSPKASAALSRRCLQNILRTTFKVKPDDLAKEIQEVLDKKTLPSHIANAIDAVRNIGNFAAHPTKSQKTGEIIEVEPGEAEWNLDVLEALFDFCLVQPEELKKKKAALNEKLKDAGKKPMA